MHELSREDARRIAVRAQLLTADRPTDLFAVVRQLTAIQAEPTDAVAPSADLVLWSRLGSAYDRADLRDALDEQALIEHQGNIWPIEDMALLRAEMAAWPGTGDLKSWEVARAEWLEANDACRRDVLDLLRTDGPLPTSALPDTCVVPWRSTGWNNNRNLPRLLNLMVERGEVATVGGRAASRCGTWPGGSTPTIRCRGSRRLVGSAPSASSARSASCARASRASPPASRGPAAPGGSTRRFSTTRSPTGCSAAGQRCSPPSTGWSFDRLRAAELFEYEYRLEMYKPAAKRVWGYYALPVLYGDRLVGKVDATAERAEGVLRVDAVHEDRPFDADTRDGVRAELLDLARWLGLDPVLPRGWE